MKFKIALMTAIWLLAAMLSASLAIPKTDYEKNLEECKKAEDDFFFATEKVAKAIEYCTKAISIKPQAWEPYQYRGVYYSSTGDLQKAIQDFTKVIELKPSNAEAYSLGFNNRGYVFL